MNTHLHVVHIEDSAEDSKLVQRMLMRDGFDCDIDRVETREQLTRALEQQKCDLILSDCTLPQFHGLEALQIARSTKPDVPFIFISGTIGEETAISSLQNGATDYVLKQRLTRLIPAVRRALTEAEGRRARSAMEAQLRQARKLEAIGTFASGIVHDFRNLLQLVKLNIELLPLVAGDAAEIGRIAAQLNRVTNQGCEMLQEIMVFAGKAEAKLVPIDTGAQIAETARLFAAGLPGNVHLKLQIEDKVPHILAEASQLDRIVTNLLVNARDAMPDGGTITVKTDLLRFAGVPSEHWQLGDAPFLRLAILDTGTGMDPSTQSHIFEPFFTTKPTGKGTGLGLSVVFGLMEAHHGFIDLASKVGEGTTFSLFFPLPAGTVVDADRLHPVCPNQILGATIEGRNPGKK